MTKIIRTQQYKVIVITTLLPLKCGFEKRKDHLPRRGKDWVLVQFTAFNSCFLKKIKLYIELIIVFNNIMLILNRKANQFLVYSSFWGGGPLDVQFNT